MLSLLFLFRLAYCTWDSTLYSVDNMNSVPQNKPRVMLCCCYNVSAVEKLGRNSSSSSINGVAAEIIVGSRQMTRAAAIATVGGCFVGW